MQDDQRLEKPQSFVVTIKYIQNNTWQGSIEWLEEKKTENFRSTLEMIKLISSALNDNDQDKNS